MVHHDLIQTQYTERHRALSCENMKWHVARCIIRATVRQTSGFTTPITRCWTWVAFWKEARMQPTEAHKAAQVQTSFILIVTECTDTYWYYAIICYLCCWGCPEEHRSLHTHIVHNCTQRCAGKLQDVLQVNSKMLILLQEKRLFL
jgi:hypothetical protein